MVRLIALTLVLVLAAAPAALAQATATDVIERAARALEDDPVYVDPDAEADLDEAAADRIRERIRERGAGPMYVAILPAEAADEAGGEAGAVGAALADELNREGTYAVVVGNSFRAGATRGILERGQAGQLAREALDAQGRNGVEPTLLDFVDRVGEARRGGQGAESGSQGGGSGGDPGGSPSGGLLLALLAGGAGLFALSRWRRRRRQQEEVSSEMEEVRETARDDLVALGEDIRALDLDAQMPNADPAFKRDYE